MYKIAKIVALSILGSLASEIYAIKLTNNTNDNLLYCCGNPANKNVTLQKHELKSAQTVEITDKENYLQIYTTQKPNALRGKYPLTNQTEDLTIVTDPMFGYKFKPTAEVSQIEPKKLPKGIGQPMLGMHNPKNIKVDNKTEKAPQPITTGPDHSKSHEKPTLTHTTKERPQYTGKRLPSNPGRKPKKPQPASEAVSEDSQQDNDLQASATEEPTQMISDDSKPLTDIKPEDKKDFEKVKTALAVIEKKADTQPAKSTYARYFTKRNLALGLGIGALSLVAWWLYKQQPRNR